MLDRIDNWEKYISDSSAGNDSDMIKKHTRTGRPLGSVDFVRNLEVITGRTLLPEMPGRKPGNQK